MSTIELARNIYDEHAFCVYKYNKNNVDRVLMLLGAKDKIDDISDLRLEQIVTNLKMRKSLWIFF